MYSTFVNVLGQCRFSSSMLICMFWIEIFGLQPFFVVAMFQEQKIKEGLYMMGLKDGIFHLSWFITYALQVGSLFFCIFVEFPLCMLFAFVVEFFNALQFQTFSSLAFHRNLTIVAWLYYLPCHTMIGS